MFDWVPNPFKLPHFVKILLFGLGICAVLAANRVCQEKAKNKVDEPGATRPSAVLEYKE